MNELIKIFENRHHFDEYDIYCPYSLIEYCNFYDKKVLDIGCGLSNHETSKESAFLDNIEHISKINDWTGIDIDFENFKCFDKKENDLLHIKKIERDLTKEDINLQKKFDFIIIKDSLHFSNFTKERRKEILTECINLLKDNGCIYFSHYIKDDNIEEKYKNHYHIYNEDELNDFNCVEKHRFQNQITTLIIKI